MPLSPKGMYIAMFFVPQSNAGQSAQWGFHPGGWGKPPLDEYNRPLYGDVFGVLPKANDADVSYREQYPC